MENTIYLNGYEFLFEREIMDFYNMKSYLTSYTSNIQLENLDRNDDNLEKDYEFFKLIEKDIEIITNGKKVNEMEKISFDIFSMLEIYLDKKSYFCKILNIDELKRKASMIQTFYMQQNQDNRYTKILQNIEKYKIVIQDEQLLFNSINDNKFIKCLFCSPYYRNFEFSIKEKGFYIVDFLEDVAIPVKLFEKIKENYVEIYGKIDTDRISNSYFKEKLSKFFKKEIKDYTFSYNLKIHYENKKIKNVYEKTILKMDNSLELSEKVEVKGKEKE